MRHTVIIPAISESLRCQGWSMPSSHLLWVEWLLFGIQDTTYGVDSKKKKKKKDRLICRQKIKVDLLSL